MRFKHFGIVCTLLASLPILAKTPYFVRLTNEITPGHSSAGKARFLWDLQSPPSNIGGADTGGGDTNVSTADDVKQAIVDAKQRDLKLMFFRLQLMLPDYENHLFANNPRFAFYPSIKKIILDGDEAAFPLKMRVLIRTMLSGTAQHPVGIINDIDQAVYRVKSHGHCIDHDNLRHDGSILPNGDICFSVERLMRIPKKNLRKEIIALAAHEHAHRFGIWNDAVLIQKFLLDAAEHDNSFGGGLNNFVLPTEFERDRPWNMVKLLNSSLPQLENKITSQDSLGACQNLGYLLGGIVTPFEEGANGDILPPSYYLKVLDLGDSVISANYVCGDVGHDLLIAMGFRPGPYFKPLPKNDLHGVETLIATMKTQQFEIEDFLSAYMSGYRVIGGSPQQYESLLPPSPESPAIVYEY